mgnify:CR=1 FL=1
MKSTHIAVLLLLALYLSASTADAHWYDWMQDKVHEMGNVLHDLIASCPIREGYKETLRSGIDKQIFGQGQAITRIVTAFQTHPYGKPLSFHFVGVCIAHLDIQYFPYSFS